MAIKIRTLEYIDVSDLPEPAQEAYCEFASDCGVGKGEQWEFEIGEKGDDSTMGSYIGDDKVELISQALRDAGMKDGKLVTLIREW